MRVLIDTNVLISVALNANGTPYQAYVKAASNPKIWPMYNFRKTFYAEMYNFRKTLSVKMYNFRNSFSFMR